MKGKRTKALFLAILMSMSLVACSTKTATTTSTSTKNKEDMTPLGKYPEKITITTAKIAQSNPHFPEGKSSQDNVTLDWIKEKLNIDVKVLWEASGGDYINKLSLGIASKEIPDMIWLGNGDYLTLKNLVDNDMLEDLTEVYKKTTGEYMKSTHKSFNGRNLEPLTFDGKLMAFPGASLGYSHDVLWIRKDWLKAVGMEVPKTLEDVKKVAKAFIEKDPGKNGVGKTVGMALNATNPVGGYSNYFGSEPIFHSFGAYPRQWMKDSNGSVYYGSTTLEMKKGLAELREMYKSGLIDKSFLTRTNPGETSALVNSNQVGMYFGPWWSVFERQDLAKTHPEADWIAVNAPLDSDGKYKHLEPSPTSNFIAVRKGYEHPEAIIKMLNLANDMARGYIEGGREAMKPYLDLGTNWTAMYPTGDINIEYFDIIPKTGHFIANYLKDNNFKGDENTTQQDRDIWKYTADYIKTKDVNSPGWGEYYARYIGSTILDSSENVSVPSAFYYTTESAADVKADLDKLEDEMYLKIIVGEEPLEYFDEFVKRWKELGGDTLTKEVQEIIKK